MNALDSYLKTARLLRDVCITMKSEIKKQNKSFTYRIVLFQPVLKLLSDTFQASKYFFIDQNINKSKLAVTGGENGPCSDGASEPAVGTSGRRVTHLGHCGCPWRDRAVRTGGEGAARCAVWVEGGLPCKQRGDHPGKAALCLLLRKQLVGKQLSVRAGLQFRQHTEKQTPGPFAELELLTAAPHAERASASLSCEPTARPASSCASSFV